VKRGKSQSSRLHGTGWREGAAHMARAARRGGGDVSIGSGWRREGKGINDRWAGLVECLEYNLHELILSGYELLYLRVVVGVVVASLTVAWIVPCVYHLRDFEKRDISNLDYML
jgi:hypothetical protein